jgi:hypothetical protein
MPRIEVPKDFGRQSPFMLDELTEVLAPFAGQPQICRHSPRIPRQNIGHAVKHFPLDPVEAAFRHLTVCEHAEAHGVLISRITRIELAA